MLRHEQRELARRRQELAVAQAELQSVRENRRTYLKAGQIFFRSSPHATQQAVAGHLSAIDARQKAVSAEADRAALVRELERQDLDDESSGGEEEAEEKAARRPARR
ncbi:hypothetical protein KFE25_005698 [Diacronema lutheri]|uniref:Uncharacterized protein n=3 Tax=Diacronema lutheri TaxID=2081491 RepID=A0A8J6C1V7_DIALT|nr:hypothetical protein KFE25_005698 [Diacronema lutheri]